jgi:hypothetical protein
MRLLYKGNFIPGERYVPGSIVKMPDGSFRVWTRDNYWEDTVATPDPFLDREPVDGRDGRDGERGNDGKPGADAKSLNPRGKWNRRQLYDVLDVVEHEGSSYVCVAPTKSEPPARAWQILAAAGEDGKLIERYFTRQIIKRTVADGAEDTTFPVNFAADVGQAITANGVASMADPHVIGVVTAAGRYKTEGSFPFNATPGAILYLDEFTPGLLSETPPETGYVVVVARQLTATAADLEVAPPIKL